MGTPEPESPEEKPAAHRLGLGWFASLPGSGLLETWPQSVNYIPPQDICLCIFMPPACVSCYDTHFPPLEEAGARRTAANILSKIQEHMPLSNQLSNQQTWLWCKKVLEEVWTPGLLVCKGFTRLLFKQPNVCPLRTRMILYS